MKNKNKTKQNKTKQNKTKQNKTHVGTHTREQQQPFASATGLFKEKYECLSNHLARNKY